MFDDVHEGVPGPCIVSSIDLRNLVDTPYQDGIIVEDGTPPGATVGALKTALSVASKLIGLKVDKERKISEWLRSSMARTMSFLIMSHDDAGGHIRLNDEGEAYVDWPGVGEQEGFEKIGAKLTEIASSLGGTYVKNPIWSKKLGKKLVTVHPLGGCPMGSSGRTGVVNHKGQVFVGDTDEVHPGLYVLDGAIIPTSVGVNPTAVISIMVSKSKRFSLSQ